MKSKSSVIYHKIPYFCHKTPPNHNLSFSATKANPQTPSLLSSSLRTKPVSKAPEREGTWERRRRIMIIGDVSTSGARSQYTGTMSGKPKMHHDRPPRQNHSRNLSRRRSSTSSSASSSSVVKSWWNSPETKRKKRVARYKLYAVEGKVKSSIKNGYRWIKLTCSRLVHGF